MMDHHDKHYHFHSNSEREIAEAVSHAISPILRILMTVSTEVQNVLDQARQNQSLVKSVDLGLKAVQTQVTDLQAQIAALQANAPLSTDDKAALVEAGTDLADSITTLQADIPANTPQAGGQPNV